MKMLPPSFGPVSTVFGSEPDDDRLSTGITVSYPILRIKGKVWSITRGASEPHVLMRADGDGPRNSIDVVIIAASQYISKVWYENGYEEGSTAAPDCFSPNGVVPDASSAKKQSNTCAGCPQNAWGSKITPAGKKAKACSDSKRAAVAPLGDIRNEAFGGAMLLRVPAASLGDFGNYGDGMDARGYKYYSIGTKMSFEATEAYPKLIFEPVRPLTDDEATAVLELRESAAVKSILQESMNDLQEAVVETTIKLPPTFPQPVPSVEHKPEVTSKVTAPPPPPPAKQVKEETKEKAKATPLPPKPSPVNDAFGGSVTPAAEAPSPKPKRTQAAVAPPPPPSDQPPDDEVVADASFEDALDAQMQALLPEN